MATLSPHLIEALLSLLRDVVAAGDALDAAPTDAGTGAPLTRAESRTISLVVASPGIGISGLAAQQDVTRSAASQMVSRLVKKGLLTRTRSTGREVFLGVTAAGAAAHRAHLARGPRLAAVAQPAYASNAQLQRDIETLVRLLEILRGAAMPR